MLRPIDFEATWADLKDTIKSVMTLDHIDRRTFQYRYFDVYSLCISFPEHFDGRLYIKTKNYLEEHVRKLYENVVASPEGILVAYHKYWLQYSRGISYLNNLYTFLNSEHSENLKDARRFGGDPILQIGELGLELWKKHMIGELRENLVCLLLGGIRNDRLGNQANVPVFHGVIKSFFQVEEYKNNTSLEFHNTVFESPFLKDVGDYYKLEATRLMQENDCPQYMEKVLKKLDDENLRSRKFLLPSSYSKVTNEFVQRMMADHLQFLLEECKRMVQQENQKDLHNMFLLFKSFKRGADALSLEIQQHITKIALDVVNSLKGENMPQLFVESLLAVHSKYNNFVKVAFAGDYQLDGALDKAFIAVVNYKENSKFSCCSSELLARYCNSLLKKNSKFSENEVEDKLSDFITIFKYITEKDVFQKFYARMLAKRLIYGHSKSMDAEEIMINKLKQIYGWEYTRKLRHIFTDMKISADLNTRFTVFLRDENVDLGVNFGISVLKAEVWPFDQTTITPFAIPRELEKSVQQFEYFYNARLSGRKLTWLHHYCNAELKLCYLKKPYIVTMNIYQMAILLLYQTSDMLNYTELQENTKLSEDQLTIQVQSLIESNLLQTCSNPITKESTFSLNKDYSNKRTKFKLKVMQKEAVQQEVEQTHVSVEKDRKFYMQAAIVRIMKARKILKHNILIQEVIKQSKKRFVPNISMIKKCIDALIDKQYIKRTRNSTDEYSYMS